MNSTKKGFTLIELMVVMGIIALLSGMAIFGIQLAQRSARDSDRRNIVDNSFKLAVEDYNIRFETFPANADVVFAADQITLVEPGSATVFETIPLDGSSTYATATDSGNTEYCYAQVDAGGGYEFGATLENGDAYYNNSDGDNTTGCTMP